MVCIDAFFIIINHPCKGRRNIWCFRSTMTSVRYPIQTVIKPSDHQKNHSASISIAKIAFVNECFPGSRRILFDRMIFHKRTEPCVKLAIFGKREIHIFQALKFGDNRLRQCPKVSLFFARDKASCCFKLQVKKTLYSLYNRYRYSSN